MFSLQRCIISIFRGIRFSRLKFGFVVRTLVRFHTAKAITTNRSPILLRRYAEISLHLFGSKQLFGTKEIVKSPSQGQKARIWQSLASGQLAEVVSRASHYSGN